MLIENALEFLPTSAGFKTHYASLFDKMLGRQTVEWRQQDGVLRKISAYHLLTDFEGHLPPLKNYGNLLKLFKLKYVTKRQRFLNNPFPFIVFEAIDFLDTIVKPGFNVLEAGSGNSSLWFLNKGAILTSLEHSSIWADSVRKSVLALENAEHKNLTQSLTLHVAAGVEAIALIKQFPDASLDLVLVDCLNRSTSRAACLQSALPKVKSRGWLVLDNSDHPNNWQAVQFMRHYERIRFTGYSPMGFHVSQTSFWQKSRNSNVMIQT